MPIKAMPENIPVILLYNVDPSWTETEKREAVGASQQLGRALTEIGHPTVFVALTDSNLAECLHSFDPAKHILLNWCESLPGIEHSEWLVAMELERMGFTYTGATPEALALAQDKFRVKVLLDEAGIPTPAWQIFRGGKSSHWTKFPAIVKPVNEHCSAGITRDAVVLNPAELRQRIIFIENTYHQSSIVEEFIDGREFHVSVIGNDELTVLPVAEMDFSFFSDVKDRLCTYDAKFIPGSHHYEKIETRLPAPLDPKEESALREVSLNAYRILGCRDYARLDIRMQNHVFYVLDVNPNADISIDASLACAAQEAGLSYGHLGSLLVLLASRRHPVMGKMAKSIKTHFEKQRTRRFRYEKPSTTF